MKRFGSYKSARKQGSASGSTFFSTFILVEEGPAANPKQSKGREHNRHSEPLPRPLFPSCNTFSQRLGVEMERKDGEGRDKGRAAAWRLRRICD